MKTKKPKKRGKVARAKRGPYADSMAQAAGQLGVDLAILGAAKESGSEAFQGSRVYLDPLREWIAANKDRVTKAVERADAEHRIELANAKYLEQRALKMSRESIRVADAKRLAVSCILQLKGRLLSIPERVSQKLSILTDAIKIEEVITAEICKALDAAKSDEYGSMECPHCKTKI